MDYARKTILVVGAAKSGLASARFLLGRGARVVLTDTKTGEALETDIAPLRDLAADSGRLTLELGGHQNASFTGCDLVVVSPGVPLSLPYLDLSRKAGIPIIAEIELAYRHLKGKIIGITGSNGKTTTTTLVSELLTGAGMKGHAAGNIGTPLIDFAADSSPDDYYAVELSSFQLESIGDFRPFIGSILNLTPDHMDRYSSFEAYVAAKERIFTNQLKTDFAVLNADDTRTAAMRTKVRSRAVLFSRLIAIEEGAFVRNGRVFFRDSEGEKDLFPVGAIALKGAHNLENVLAACAMVILAGAPSESLEDSIRKFKGVEHRIEWVSDVDEVQYFNDSKATNVDATIKSLEAFPGNILLIIGGRDKAGDFTALRSLVRERVKHLILIGEAADKIRKALSGTAETSEAQSMEEAVSICRSLARRGDIVLLAPACASFDMFQNYEHRGRVFKEAVRRIRQPLG
ncbi:MAG: UDP-N-acetylmuramoyl-L-alanine--D-glutamate ligase [Acidobacteria bacterium]|nr:UDP-N-acetylmuramoyl-L-alanine--D-glutamate ligase [Acidobacteriota bacterium]